MPANVAHLDATASSFGAAEPRRVGLLADDNNLRRSVDSLIVFFLTRDLASP
jgi:hypothetical protein